MMKEILRPIVPSIILKWNRKRFAKKQLKIWESKGRPVPPPHLVKQKVISEYQKKYNYPVLVETGTFMGDMVEAQKSNFKQIVSIELSEVLFEKAKERFKKEMNVTILQGDSGKVLGEIVRNIKENAIFWLDGHYSDGVTAKGEKDCPIFEELDAIFNEIKSNYIILIDDARCFDGTGDYPTLEALTTFVREKNNNCKVEVINDIIRYTFVEE